MGRQPSRRSALLRCAAFAALVVRIQKHLDLLESGNEKDFLDRVKKEAEEWTSRNRQDPRC